MTQRPMNAALAGLALALLAAASACSTSYNAWRSVAPAAIQSPEPEIEFRAVWVATVANIDWPSEPGLSAESQQAQAIAILDQAVDLGLNAIVLQVRPHGDTLYRSELEPWSAYLTGEQGLDPGYDPLAFWVAEAHARGLELHAWFNPFRASHPADPSEIHPSHISKQRPQLIRQVGAYLWLDPAEPDAQEHSLAVIADVIRRYDIDGVHLDDYFYPYPSDETPFPDDPAFTAYTEAGGSLDKNAWRRTHINRFIEDLASTTRAITPSARIGVSPFGIWRPGHPEGVVGFDAYEGLAADAKLWLQAGWVDYAAPQLYWTIDSEGQPFETLLTWWQQSDTRNRGVWPGLYLTRIKADEGWHPDEIEQQITLLRQRRAGGFILFSMIGLEENRQGVADQLKATVLATPAIVPQPWFGSADRPAPPPRVSIRQTADGQVIRWMPRPGPSPVFRWVLAVRTGSGWQMYDQPGTSRRLEIPNSGDPTGMADAVVITPVGRFGVIGTPAAMARTASESR